jgi:radical SAM superfamily enzyme YgiQ (UPF0313 family)
MRLLLINPPNAFYDMRYLAPPLGLLTLAALARESGYSVSVLDFNLEVISDPSLGSEDPFYDFACRKICEQETDVVGFTSMCLESHVSLELARRLKRLRPQLRTIFGGTHFGAIAKESLENFWFIDYVVAGEGDHAIISILERLANAKIMLPGNVWYREQGLVLPGTREISRPSLESLPFPAYDLVDLQRYFRVNPNCLLNYEAGRGCIFKCAFCYSPFQYGDSVRNKEPQQVVDDLRRLAELGARHVFFVQDNVLNSPRWASEVCAEISEAKIPLTWECYITYPQLDEKLIDELARGGCIGIFTGIDAVTPESQKRMNKRFLKSWEEISRKLSYCLEKGILPICAFILEGSNQPSDKIDATINTAIECVHLGCEVHINTLTIYNKTNLALSLDAASYSYSQIKPELLLDTPPIVQENPLARQYPQIFPYHSTCDNVDDWEIFITKAYVVSALIIGLQQTSYQFAIEEGNSIWRALDCVDQEFVESVRRTPVANRRLECLLRFIESFELISLSELTTTRLHREVAKLILASAGQCRTIEVRVGQLHKSYFLSWFVPSSEINGTNRAAMLEFGQSAFPAPGNTTVELALRSQNDAVKFYAISKDKLELLLKLSRASIGLEPVTLGAGLLAELENEGWIWAKNSGLSGSRLENGMLAA